MKVNYLPEFAIERAAAELIGRYRTRQNLRTTPIPIPVDLICELECGLRLEIGDVVTWILDNDVLGALFLDSKLVFVNDQVTHEGRYNFTIAHELGHWELHREQVLRWRATQQSLPLVPAGACPDVICRRGNRSHMEWQADRFGAALLMPKSELLHELCEFVTCVGGSMTDTVVFLPTSDKMIDLVSNLSSRFTVSKSAMRQRLKGDLRLTLTTSMVQPRFF